MADAMTTRDLQLMVDLIEESRRQETPAGLPAPVLQILRQLVPYDQAAFNELEPATQRVHVVQSAGDPAARVIQESEPQDEFQAFWLHYCDCEPCSYPTNTGDDRSVTTISDFYSLRQWHGTGMYADELTGLDHEAMVCLGAPAGRSRRLLLFRSEGRDFDARERLILSLLRPHLNEVYQELQRRRRAELPLTPHQLRLLRLVARGLSNKEIARELVISVTTVRTHLEHIFRLLDVTSRGAAVAEAFPAPPY